jgi:protein TonB
MPLTAGNWNDCGFPPEADMDGVDSTVVSLTVTVSTEGRPTAVTVLKDPGHGFGRLARQCALRKSFQTGQDRGGRPLTMTTPPFTVRFSR